MKTLSNLGSAGRGWLAAVIGVLGILGAPRETVWAKNIGYRETIRNTDFLSAGVGGLRNVGTGSITLRGLTGNVHRAYLYWAGPSRSQDKMANSSVSFDGHPCVGQHIGATADNTWGYRYSHAYMADVTEVVMARKNATYKLAGFMKQGTNVNVNGASLLVFYQDPYTNNNRDIVLFDGNDSNAPNAYDALDWNVMLRDIRITNRLANGMPSGAIRVQLHVSDGQTYRDPAVYVNGRVMVSAGSIFQGASVPGANNGPLNNGRLWDIKTWDVTRFLGPGTNYLRKSLGYYNTAGDCLSLVAAVINLPTGVAPDDDRSLTNHAPSVTAEPVIQFNKPDPLIVEANVLDEDGDALTTAISMNGVLAHTGTIPSNAPVTIGKLSLTNAFPLGTNQVVFAATDGDLSGNAMVQVEIIDNTPPVLTVPPDMVTRTEPGESRKVVTFVATATDDFGPVSVSCAPPSGYAFPIGVNTVNCSAVDGAKNVARGAFTITVLDGQPPLLNCPADIVRPAAPGTNVAVVTYTVVAKDTDTNLVITCTPPSGSVFPMGTNVVTCSARDTAGNSAQCSFKVIIVDLEPPVITHPTNMIVANDLGQCSAVVHFTVTMRDNMPGGTLVCTPPSGSTFSFGTNLVVCIATDAAGNRMTNTFRVIVIDAEQPVLTLPSDIAVPTAPGKPSAVVTFSASAKDNCSKPSVVCTPASGSVFPCGTNVVRCTARDAAGNVGQGTFKVVVLDLEPPVIKSVSPTNKMIWPPNHKMVPVTFTVVATDNCGMVHNSIIAVQSNQPTNGSGDGNTSPDYQILGSLSLNVLADLRSERDGSLGDRIYTVTIQSMDKAGNTAKRDVNVTVPKTSPKKR